MDTQTLRVLAPVDAGREEIEARLVPKTQVPRTIPEPPRAREPLVAVPLPLSRSALTVARSLARGVRRLAVAPRRPRRVATGPDRPLVTRAGSVAEAALARRVDALAPAVAAGGQTLAGQVAALGVRRGKDPPALRAPPRPPLPLAGAVRMGQASPVRVVGEPLA